MPTTRPNKKILFFYYLFLKYFCFVLYCFVTFIGVFYIFYFQFSMYSIFLDRFQKSFQFRFHFGILSINWRHVKGDHSIVSLHLSNSVFVLCFLMKEKEKNYSASPITMIIIFFSCCPSFDHCWSLIHDSSLVASFSAIIVSTLRLLLLHTANCTYISVTRLPSEYYKYYCFVFRIAFIFIVIDAKEMILMWLFINRFLTIHVVKHIIIFAATILYARDRDRYIA